MISDSRVLLAAVAAAMTVTATQADEFSQLGAHTHGEASLSIAQQGQALTVVLDSPAINLVGFEHSPATDAQKKTLSDAIATLHQGYDLIGLPESALCLLDATEVKQSLQVTEKGDHDDHKGHDHHDDHEGHDHHDDHKDHDHHDDHEGHDHHDDHKDHDHHDDHKDPDHHDDHEGHDDHAGHEHHDGEGGHSDIRVEWSFRCMKPAAIDSVQVGLFKPFPLLEKLNAEWALETGQGARALNAQQTLLTF